MFLFTCVTAAPVLWTFQIYPTAVYRTGKACLPRNDIKETIIPHVFVSLYSAIFYPVVALAILTIFLILKLFQISKDRQKLTGGNTSADSNKELQAAITMVFLGAVQCIVYIPTSIIWGIYFSSAVLQFLSPKWQFILAAVGRSAVSLTIVCHFYNLYLYLYRIPAFRKDFLYLLICKCASGTRN